MVLLLQLVSEVRLLRVVLYCVALVFDFSTLSDETLTAFLTTTFEDSATAFCSHASTESMLACTSTF